MNVKIDNLGRIVIPVKARQMLGLKLNGLVKISFDETETKIIIEKQKKQFKL